MEQKQRYTTLDGMRGVAAFAVVCFHFQEFFFKAWSGCLAVDFFFCLSGFVIVKAYDHKILEGMSPATFIRMRFLRFYPLYFLAIVTRVFLQMAALAVGAHLSEVSSIKDTLYIAFFNVFMVPSPIYWKGIFAWSSWVSFMLFPLLPQGWSLIYELFSNYLYSIIRLKINIKNLTWWILICAATLGSVIIYNGGDESGGGFWGWNDALTGTCRVLFSFSVGCYLALYPPKKIPVVSPYLLLTVLTACLFIEPDRYSVIYNLGFLFLLSPTLVLFGSVSEPSSETTRRIFLALGAISYPLYVFHDIIYKSLLGSLGLFYTVMPDSFYRHLIGFCTIPPLILSMLALEKYYDRPARRWLQSSGVKRAA